MKHPQVTRLAALALAALPVPAALADTPAQLDAVTVTASKRDQKLDSINGAAYVRSSDALAANQVENTLQLGGVTSAQDFYNPALTIYVDGVPQLPVAASQQLLDVDQVELLKGPQSTLYGRSALGGVLNIVTRQPDNETHVRASAGVASRDGYLFKAGASAALVEDMLYGSVSLATSDAPGRLSNPITGSDGVGGSSTNAGAAKLRLAPAGSPWEIGLAVSGECTRARQDAYVPFDDPGAGQAYVMPGFPAGQADFKQRRCGGSQAINAQYDFEGWRLTALAAWQRLHYRREYPIGPYFTQQPEHWRQQVQELRLASTGQRTVDSVFGLYRQRVTQSRDYINDLVAPVAIRALDTHSTNTSESLAAYADLTWHATEALDLSAGLHWSHDKASIDYSGQSLNYSTFGQDPFGGQDTTRGNTALGRVSAGYRLDDAWRVYANASQGYKPGGFNLAPSSAADAQPYGREKAVSYELGARYQGESLRGGVALYRIDVRDAQLYVSNQIGYQHLENVGRTRSSGVEFDAAWDVTEQWTVGLQGNWTRARFRALTPAASGACDDNRVPFSPAYMVAASAQAAFSTSAGMLRPRVEVRRVGSQYFDVGNTLRQDAYTLMNASLSWQPRSSLTLTAYINNLTDKRYRTYAFAGGALGNFALVDPGRTVGVNVAYEY
ncbi:TonB-dependent receptor [Bordetella holmesii]|uniref:TonB dependent receptor family protein n=2 Tax=Bordetella holmesii TaxID=35814 RepID=A0ABN0RXI2_9BORD|nr:TonB-dependent receptor [Bordetella holmesii]AIT27703.1 tonB dependent receptor family protein [Bordetella holmesii 44057]EWM40478.1 tonB dependent receptor family protein [Bordetella holmesii 35009]EWM42533.1 tonB dependent receptor family protein [Bordetella holmesii 41130]EWM49280.1 tonB dependent receptor family protein [Bordetella holmesii 70147]AMD46492.1 ligand-gated channel [Bordetella holmesii H558]